MLRAEAGRVVIEGEEEGGKWEKLLGESGELVVVKEEAEMTDTLEIFLLRWIV